MKVLLDKGAKEIDAPSGRRYRAKDGVYEMSQSDAKAVVKLGGANCSLSGTTRTEIGYRCEDCDFASFFTTCSRCGGKAERE